MKTLLSTSTLLITILLLLCSCKNNEEQIKQLDSERSDIVSQSNSLADSINMVQSKINELKNQVNSELNDLAQDSLSTDSLMKAHVWAVAAIAGGAKGTDAALNLKNDYTDDEEQWGQVAVVAALAYALINSDEVSMVWDKANSYHEHKKSSLSKIDDLNTTINTEESILPQMNARIQKFNYQADSLQSVIKSLQ